MDTIDGQTIQEPRGELFDAATYQHALEGLPREDLVAELVRMRVAVAQLQLALESRLVIEQAKAYCESG